MLGEGTFTIPEASRLTNVSPGQLRRWFAGPRALFEARRWGRDVNLSFADLISAMVIQALRNEGVKMPKIRRIAAKAARELGSERPFAVNLATDGLTIFRWLTTKKRRGKRPKVHLVDMDSEQAAIPAMLKPFLRNIEFGAESAERWWPLGKRAGVVVDPKHAMGSPVTAKHRVPTRVLYGAHKAGESAKRIAAWYEIPKAEVLAALKFEETLRPKAA